MQEEALEGLTVLTLRRSQLLGKVVEELETRSDTEVPDKVYKEALRKVKGLENEFFMTDLEAEKGRINKGQSLDSLEIDMTMVMENLGLLHNVEEDEDAD